ncbi:anhydro-N-acetylmuramic acid kinase [Ideonella dechloratans]|uniref:anhydro-N-acetylmuramic acid kinase n=1 Tax=Ideonella dechloratans TaxID=36863 RepID=UPI0035B029E5
MDTEVLIGLMSGTSLDGVDGVLAQFDAAGHPQVRAHAHRPFPAALRDELLALNQSGADELHRGALSANALAEVQAQVVADLLGRSGLAADAVRAVGSHGQTVRHRPGEFDGTGYTLQLNQPALLAERCGIDVVSDFRSRDVAAGGQGAPLVPAFHAVVFGGQASPAAVLNLGGMANLTLLPAAGDPAPVRGFDCGPGNALLDFWIQQELGRPYDEGGHWGAGGRVDPALLARLLDEPFLRAAPPKSTGRDLFNPPWLLARLTPGLPPQDVQATLAEFTARCAAEALVAQAPDTTTLLCCGGGALNQDLMRRLQALLPDLRVASTDSAGLPPLQVEATAFAWLAWAFLHRQPGNRPEVTGAGGLRVLGALHPA